MGKLKRREICAEIESFSAYDLDGPVKNAMELFTRLKNHHPLAYIDVSLDDGGCYSSPSCTIEITVDRMETDAELAKRQKVHDKELKKEENRVSGQEKRERTMLAKLKEKYPEEVSTNNES